MYAGRAATVNAQTQLNPTASRTIGRTLPNSGMRTSELSPHAKGAAVRKLYSGSRVTSLGGGQPGLALIPGGDPSS